MWVAVINMAILVWGMPTCVIPGTHLPLSTLCSHQNTPALLVYFLLLSSFGEKTVKVWELDGISLCWCQNCNIELILNLKYFFSCSLWPGLGLRSLFLKCSLKNKQTKKQKQTKTKNVAFSSVTMHHQASTRKKRAQGSWIGTPIFVYRRINQLFSHLLPPWNALWPPVSRKSVLVQGEPSLSVTVQFTYFS